jgi:hypothetical protein
LSERRPAHGNRRSRGSDALQKCTARGIVRHGEPREGKVR